MIIEHCFISSDSDSAQFLSSTTKLQAMAQADARGIAAYYGLEKKTEGETDPEAGLPRLPQALGAGMR